MADGQATYTGHEFVERVGHYTGKVSFYSLGKWLDQQPVLLDSSEHASKLADAEAVELTLLLRDGNRVVKTFDSGTERFELWAAAAIVDGVSSRIRWEKASEP